MEPEQIQELREAIETEVASRLSHYFDTGQQNLRTEIAEVRNLIQQLNRQLEESRISIWQKITRLENADSGLRDELVDLQRRHSP